MWLSLTPTPIYLWLQLQNRSQVPEGTWSPFNPTTIEKNWVARWLSLQRSLSLSPRMFKRLFPQGKSIDCFINSSSHRKIHAYAINGVKSDPGPSLGVLFRRAFTILFRRALTKCSLKVTLWLLCGHPEVQLSLSYVVQQRSDCPGKPA